MTPREATRADVGPILALQPICFPEDPWTRGMIEEEVTRAGGIFLALDDERGLLGFVMGWNVLSELHVLQVGVRPDARRTGAGRTLMEALHAAARGAEAAWLEVRADNEAALHLYSSLGYCPTGRRPRYYPDGCDAVVMRRTLP